MRWKWRCRAVCCCGFDKLPPVTGRRRADVRATMARKVARSTTQFSKGMETHRRGRSYHVFSFVAEVQVRCHDCGFRTEWCQSSDDASRMLARHDCDRHRATLAIVTEMEREGACSFTWTDDLGEHRCHRKNPDHRGRHKTLVDGRSHDGPSVPMSRYLVECEATWVSER